MKNLSKMTVFAFVFAAFLLGSTGFANAETGTGFGYGTDVRVKYEDSKRESKPLMYPAVDVRTKVDGVSAEDRAKIEEKMTLETRVDANGKLKVEDKVEVKKTEDGQRIKDLLKLRADIEKRDERGTEDKPKPVTDIFKNYFTRVIENLNAVHARISNLADRVDSRLEKLVEEGVEIETSKKYAAEARIELKLAKISIDAATASYKTESSSAKPLRASVVNDRGVTLTTSEDEYNACVQKGGKVMEYDKNRCTLDEGKTIYINPSLAERVALLVANTRDNSTSSYPKTLANIKEAKEHLKLAHRHLVTAISNLKPGLNGMGDKDKKVETVGTVKVESTGAVKVD
jgi:hypothetical protein